MRRVLDGDEGAFRALYRDHAARLFQLALRLTGGRDADAEDVVQEAWRRAVRALGEFEHRSSLATWLSSIVTRCALEKHRSALGWGGRPSVRPPPEAGVRSRGSFGGRTDVEGHGAPSETASHEGAATARLDLERAFERLAPGFQAVLVLHDLEGYRHRDIAELLGCSEGTSKSQLSRARARMRELLGEDYEE